MNIRCLCILLLLFTVATRFYAYPAGIDAASRAVRPSSSASGASFDPQFSADGSHLVFISHANNLVINDDHAPWLDVFARHLVTSNTVLVSVNTSGTGGGNADAHSPSISSNGQFIAFVSRASNLVPGDTNNAEDVFVRDVLNDTTRLVSVDVNGRSPHDPQATLNIPLSGAPLISADGRWVFFESRATNLVSSPARLGSVNIYGRDLWSNVTVLVSADTNGLPLPDKVSLASISDDGRFAAFISTNRSVHVGVTNLWGDAYARDLQSGVTLWVSTNVAITMGGFYAVRAVTLSADGHFALVEASMVSSNGGTFPVVKAMRQSLNDSTDYLFVGDSTRLSSQISADGRYVLCHPFVFDCIGMTNQQVGWDSIQVCGAIGPSDGSFAGSLSRDGRFVAFRLMEGYVCNDVITPDYVYRRNLNTGETNVVAVTTNGTRLDPTDSFITPQISPDGSRVALAITDANLVANDFNNVSDVFLRDVDAAETELVSIASTNRPASVGISIADLGARSLSSDGDRIVFTRFDDPSVPRDTNAFRDVFLSDRATGICTPISVYGFSFFDHSTFPPPSSTNNTNAVVQPVISADGSTIAAVRLHPLNALGILSRSEIVVARSSNSVFSTGVSLASLERGGPQQISGSPTLSSNGALLAFHSTARMTEEIDGNSVADVFIHFYRPLANGTYMGTNYLVSRATNYGAGNGVSTNPVVSTDAHWIAFLSQASDLVAGNAFPYTQMQCLTADLGTNRTSTNFLENIPKHLASYGFSLQPFTWTNATDTNLLHTNLNAIFTPIPNTVASSLFAGNQRHLFYALADRSAVYRHDLLSTHTNVVPVGQSNGGTIVATNIVAGSPNLLACTNAQNISVNFDGTLIAFERPRAGASNLFDLYVADMVTGSESLVSANTLGSLANGTSTSPLISADGRYVIFQSAASDLAANDTNGFRDIFLRDRLLGTTMLVSANAAGRSGNGPSAVPVLSADGRTAAFRSFASDLIPGDFNDKRDVFVLRLGSADSDGDGLDDDWELAYFDDLSRNGAGDFDNDGASDYAEFLAGTDPKNDGYYFRVLTITPLGGNSTRVMWAGNANRSYRVEYKDDFNSPAWTAVEASIAWNGNVATVIDASGVSGQRFYRAVRLP